MSDVIEQLVQRYDGGGMTRRELVLALSNPAASAPCGGWKRSASCVTDSSDDIEPRDADRRRPAAFS